MPATEDDAVQISQSVAILVDGNNIERSIHSETNRPNTMLNFDTLVPRLLGNRGLNRLVYFREGKQISSKLKERLHANYHGSVRPCHKSADIPLSIKATQLANKVDTIIIMSGDSDYVELVRHLKAEGVRVEIAAVPATTSKLLTDEADYFHEVTSADWFTLEVKKSVRKGPRTRKKEQPAETQAG
ncbi:MAG: NYN domain-containing protein [Thiohalobacterales bacterium]|nr:NYN domain-containing protein [Thiohalobacterales bacterium]